MSGLCGIVNFDGAPVDPELLERMAGTSAYRGPDGIRYWVDGPAGFAHLALHTTPESLRERQPLLSRREDIVLTADARVDNRDELIRTLTAKGCPLEKNPTDADLILAAYECWGEACPEHIIGDFAFAIWDAAQKKLFCARDSAGIRTFCYNLEGSAFRFGSDGRQILADERVSRDLDGYAISDYLTMCRYDRSRTIFAEVQRLLPGHCLVLNAAGPRSWRYWNPDRNPPIRYSTDAEYVEHFRALLFRCVADRMRSVKGAAAIRTSGGMDSSSVAAIAQALYTGGQATTQPVGYTDVFDTLTECDEREYSLTLPAETGIEFHQTSAERFCYLDDEVAHAPALDSPWMSYESLCRHEFQLARERNCDVLMTGDGGDILFTAARQQYVDHARSGRWWRLWPWLIAGRREGRPWVRLVASLVVLPLLPTRIQYLVDRWRGSTRYWQVPIWIHPQLREKTRPAERLMQQGYPRRFRSSARQMQYEHMIGLFPLGFIMEWWTVKPFEYGLEVRSPLLDRRLADFVLAAPVDLGARPGAGNSKWILRQAVAGVVPEKIRRRSRKGSWTKYYQHMIHQIRHKLRALFTDTQLAQHHLVDNRILLDEFDAYFNGTSRYPSGLFFLSPMCMERWFRTHVPDGTTIRFEQLQVWQFE